MTQEIRNNAGDASIFNLLRLLYGETPDTETSTETPEETESGSEGTEKTESVEFSDAQQKHFNAQLGKRTASIRKERDDMKRRLEVLEAKETEREAEAEKQREAQLKEQGQLQQLLDEKEKKFNDESAKSRAELEATKAELKRVKTENLLDNALAQKSGINPKMIRVIKHDLLEGVSLNGDFVQLALESDPDSSIERIVVRDRGENRITDGKGEFMSEIQAIDKYLDSFPEFMLASQRSVGGGGSANSPAPEGDELTRQIESAKAEAQKTGRDVHIAEYQRLLREQRTQRG